MLGSCEINEPSGVDRANSTVINSRCGIRSNVLPFVIGDGGCDDCGGEAMCTPR